MKSAVPYLWLVFIMGALLLATCKKQEENTPGKVQLAAIKIGDESLDLQGNNDGIPVDSMIYIEFNDQLDISTAAGAIQLFKDPDSVVAFDLSSQDNNTTIILNTESLLSYQSAYRIIITGELAGAGGETFPGITVNFFTENGKLLIENITINGIDFGTAPQRDIDYENLDIEIWFSHQLDPEDYKPYFFVSGNFQKNILLSADN
ncbi:MAG: Ig-like domain-containing protein, partial [Bacteroides sp.]|nr:Ig-like domain-containing protein [Bacteroides sp.]